jgi:hypothetical protein
MEYGLRVNHHAADHGALILDGIRPALRALGLRAALRPHWQQGPHVLIALDIAAADAPQACATVAQAVQGWLDNEPPREPLDVEAFHARARKLAALEGLPFEPVPPRPDRLVEQGRFAVPHPLGESVLAPLRDSFKADTLDDACALIALRLASPASALVELACRIICLERLAWRDGLNFWPLSLQGQARASQAASSTFSEMLATLRPTLVAQLREEGVLDPVATLSAPRLAWIARLQAAYGRLLAFVDAASPDFASNINARIRGDRPRDPRTLSKADAQTLSAMDHPTQFAYRLLMNFIYDLFPLVGFSASQRLLLCHLITNLLEAEFPQILSRSYADGAALCR